MVVVTGMVPVPLAACTLVEALDVEDDDELLDDDEVELPVPPSNTFWIRAVNSELVRLSAVWLAILARPLALETSALPITLISELAADCAESSACAFDQ